MAYVREPFLLLCSCVLELSYLHSLLKSAHFCLCVFTIDVLGLCQKGEIFTTTVLF